MKKYFLILLTSLITVSCNNDKNDETSLIDAFHNNYYDVNISPALQNFKTAIDSQIVLTERFHENPTEENLKELQDQWLVSATSFSRMSAYNVKAVKALFFDLIIYNYEVTPSKIEENIADKTTFDEDYFLTKTTVSKGLGAVEYLLFNNQDSEMAFNLLIQDPFRMDYLLGATHNVLEKTNSLINFWESDYKEVFANSTETSCAVNARCLAFNQLINVIDVIRVTKLGKPAGLESSSTTNVEGLEAFRSENSLILLRSAIEEIEYVYSESTINFSEIVNDIAGSTEVTGAINTSFNKTYTLIDGINTSLYTAIENEDPNVELLYDSLLTLVQYFSVDAASILSVTILPTDNDGD